MLGFLLGKVGIYLRNLVSIFFLFFTLCWVLLDVTCVERVPTAAIRHCLATFPLQSGSLVSCALFLCSW